jgi:hypothetical protein
VFRTGTSPDRGRFTVADTQSVTPEASVKPRALAAALLAVMAGPTQARASPHRAARADQCLLVSQFEAWRAPDASTINIRVGLNEYYRLELAARCPALTFPGARLISRPRGTGAICSAIDWNLAVAEGGPDDFPMPCIVRSMRRLSAEEAAALPPKEKP